MEMPAKRSRWGSRLLPFLLALILCGGPTLRALASQEQHQPEASAEQSEKPAKKERKAEAANRLPAVRWRNPGDTASLDLLNGAGGDKDAPDPRADYTVVKEDLHGTLTNTGKTSGSSKTNLFVMRCGSEPHWHG
jgi:hypothetical protein